MSGHISSSFFARGSSWPSFQAISSSKCVSLLAAALEQRLGRAQALPLAGNRRLLGGVPVVAAHRVGDVGEVAHALGRHDGAAARGLLDGHLRQLAGRGLQAQRIELRQQRLIQRGDAVVVEARGHGAEHRHLLHRHGEQLAVALHLLAHVAEGVLGALAVELVDGDEVGEVEHVDLLELAGGAELRGHDVERGVDVRHDGGVALADARGLDDDEVEAGQLAGGDDFRQRGGDLRAGVARGQRAHEDVAGCQLADGVHADAVAEQRAAGALARGVDRHHGDLQGSSWSRRRRRISSSVRLDLPEPPVPVMPRVGTLAAAPSCSN
jgi:hypothetical protein